MDARCRAGLPQHRAKRQLRNLVVCSVSLGVLTAPALAESAAPAAGGGLSLGVLGAVSSVALATANGISVSGEVWTDPDVGPFGPGDADLGGETALYVGGDTVGTLTVAEQTRLTTKNLMIAVSAGRGEVTVTGGSSLSLLGCGGLGVGGRGTGSLTISGGGTLNTPDAAACSDSGHVYIGQTAGATGSLTITGPGSRMDVSHAPIWIATATVITDIGWGTPGATASASVRVLDGGVLIGRTSHVATGPFTGNPTGQETSIATVLVDGAGSQWNLGEFLLIGAERGFGTVIVSNGGVITAPESTVVFVNGVLAGNGTVVGGVNNAGGIIAPGLSPGTLTIDGGLNFDSGALETEVAGTRAGQFDVLRVTGDAIFSGGTMRFYFINGYLPRAGESVRVLEAQSVTGLENMAVEIDGLSPAFRYNVNTGAGGVTLVAVSDAAPAQQELSIDVEPRDRQNRVPVKSQATLQVAVRSTRAGEVDAYAFDACDLDLRTVRFGPRGARPTGHWKTDVDRDGDRDLVLSFDVRDTGLRCADTTATLSAKTRARTLVSGSDAIRAVGCGRH